MLSPLAKEQGMADADLVSKGKAEQDSALFISRPYIVYLSRELSRHDEDPLQVLLNKISGETKSFWATKKLRNISINFKLWVLTQQQINLNIS